MSLKSKLGRMKSHISLPETENTVPKEKKTTKDNFSAIPFLEKWTENLTSVYRLDGSHCLIRETSYPLDYQHGSYRFNDLLGIVDSWNNSPLEHPLSSAGHQAGDLFFFDTETTGLGGGTGNTIFLLGYAFFENDRVVVRQHILPEPGNEIPLYQSFLEKVNYETLVTYNGKAFDWPQLKTRHTLIKEHVPKLPDFGHFDLYHGSRRLWKNKLDKVKLAAVEKDILGVQRENDIPGYLAPIIYFDFVERKDPEILFGIMKHNEIDVLSLITLYIHLSRQVLQLDGYNRESLEIARWLKLLGNAEAARQTYEAAIQEGTETEQLTALHGLALQWKKDKQYNKAKEAWELVAAGGNERQRVEAWHELAKMHEHHFRDYEAALFATETLYVILNGRISLYGLTPEDLEKRSARLQKKKAKNAALSADDR
ncbi:hypothetical protein D0469_11985 [Peribacillus saganii]|uniref:YprB ribonuclease H-like domain-containing protein n=1 Tax=Peribacillus saganii TaxID=2303992 RepID=A0A372LNF3_9BACI|nr:ribonuclease H-like domain-containing protein [Peribacillus saganii]RFU68452.1 hypothetical protein D0469_11985 [Peribacillus saganii]